LIKVPSVYKGFWSDTTRFKILFGGAGSAKSHTVGRKIITRLVSEENHKWLITRKVARTLRVSVFQLFKNLISQEFDINDFNINKSDMTITYKRNGSMLLFFGLDDIEKLKSIEGITSIWVEEASECDKGDILELNRRLRGITKYYKEFIITFNPISHLHWLKEHFFDNPHNNPFILKTTYKDNPFIDDEYKQEIEDIRNYDIQQYNIYALGEWGVLNTNIIYHNFSHTKHTAQLTINDFDVLHCGVDFNVSGTTCVICGVKDDKAYIVDGWAVYDTQQLADKINGSKYLGKKIVIYPDASGGNQSANAAETSLDILRKNGLTIRAHKANPAVRDRINTVNRLLAQDRLYINDNVEKMIYSLQTQAYLDNGKPEKFTEHKGGAIDDWNDALGYFIYYYFPLKTYTKLTGNIHNR